MDKVKIQHNYEDEPSCFLELEQLCRDLQAKAAKECAEMAIRNIEAWKEVLNNNGSHRYQAAILHMMAWAQNIVAVAELIAEAEKDDPDVKEILQGSLKCIESFIKKTRKMVDES